MAPSVPGLTGTPASFASLRAVTLSPIWAMTSGEGPMKTRPAFSTAAAKAGFSERKP